MGGELRTMTVAMTTHDRDRAPRAWVAEADAAGLTIAEWAAESMRDSLQRAADAWHADHRGVLACPPDVH